MNSLYVTEVLLDRVVMRLLGLFYLKTHTKMDENAESGNSHCFVVDKICTNLQVIKSAEVRLKGNVTR